MDFIDARSHGNNKGRILIGFWISIFLMGLASLFTLQQFSSFAIQNKLASFLEEQNEVHQKLFNRMQVVHYMRSGSYDKKQNPENYKRRLVKIPVSLLHYLEPSNDKEKKRIEKVLDALYFKNREQMKKEFLKKLVHLYKSNREMTMSDLLKLEFERKEDQAYFQKVAHGTKTLPSICSIFNMSKDKKWPLFHLPKAVIAVFFNTLECEKIESIIQSYIEGGDVKEMDVFLNRSKHRFFDSGVVYKKAKNEYIEVRSKGQTFYQKL